MTTHVIVGAGLAGAKAAEALRERAAADRIVLVGDETDLPYERPPLSKDYLKGAAGRDDSRVHEADWYDESHIELRLGMRATVIAPAAHTVTLADGTTLGYDRLLLATGSRPRLLPLPGADAAGVHLLRRVGDAESLKATLGSVGSLVILGAGWIGLEVAAAAREAGVDVTVVERSRLPLLAALGPEVGQVFANLHSTAGVDFRWETELSGLAVADGAVTGVHLRDGTTLAADAVLIAAGVLPNVELAQAAGLDVDNGVLVDETLRTSDPDIYAVGDIAAHDHPVLHRRIRVEHWATALNQPAVAAAGMTGTPTPYRELPYFFTDQYDLGMEYIGAIPPGGYDAVVFRGDVPGREFLAFWLVDGRVVAGMNVNIWDVVEPIKALILSGRPVDAVRLADPAVPLEELAAEH